MAKRIQLRRTKGWRMPANTVKVDRTTRWGNPFGAPYMMADLAVDLFRDAIRGFFDPGKLKHLSDSDFDAVYQHKLKWQKRLGLHPLSAVHDLRGKNLACWCKPGDPCHADVLLELANPSTPEPRE